MAFTMSFTAVALALISWPCTFVTLSPALKPALSATDPWTTSGILTPGRKLVWITPIVLTCRTVAGHVSWW